MMKIPLYDQKNIPRNPSPHSNFGLWYDKFANQWFNNGDRLKLEFNKVEWIQGAESFSFEEKESIREFLWRRIRMVQGLGGQFWVFETQSPLVVGLGRTHPVENGMTWDYISGLPYIPGSSIKGALKASNEQYFKTYHFIDQIAVLDAIPLFPPALRGEVMTPHYGSYYQNAQTPGDWFEPNPIPFLTVAPGQRFLFSVIAPREWHADVEKWIERTLIWMGLGAKTAVAFGRFERIKAEEQRLHGQLDLLVQEERRERQRQSLNPLEQELWTDGYYDNPDRFMQAMTQKWLEKMEEPSLPLSDRVLLAQKLKDWYITNKPQEWKKPNKKNQIKIARIMKVLKEE